MTTEKNLSLEHQGVPIAHQGLHQFLYSSDDEHGISAPSIPLEHDGTEVVTLDHWRSLTSTLKVAGVYAVLDTNQIYQYVGYSRDIKRSLESHLAQNGSEICAFTRVQTFKYPKRELMELLRDEWVADLDYIPTGNQDNRLWASTIGEAAKVTMSEGDRQLYEEKKLKLRKAMADNTLIDELAENEEHSERHRQLESIVKNDDWSSIIQSSHS